MKAVMKCHEETISNKKKTKEENKQNKTNKQTNKRNHLYLVRRFILNINKALTEILQLDFVALKCL